MSHYTSALRVPTSEHIEYMDRYYGNPRESDKKIAAIVRRLVSENDRDPGALSLLDMGCMTGNLALYLKHEFPAMSLTASDIDPYAIEDCRKRPELEGVDFKIIDILDPKDDATYDFVVASAAFYGFDEDQFEVAMRNIASLLNSGGWFIQFDWIHEFDQLLTIREKSKREDKLVLHFRPLAGVRESLERCGFRNVQAEPFRMPFDLPRSEDPDALDSYTVIAEDGERMCFRGVLFQPWCHLWAQAG